MNRRVPLSPKKQKSANIIDALDSCPTSPIKKVRSSESPRTTRSRRAVTPTISRNKTSPRRFENHSSPVKLSPLKVFTEQDVYKADIKCQIADNKDVLILSPPQVLATSPSPRKRISEHILHELQTSERIPRKEQSDLFDTRQNAFLTPPRPRLSKARQVMDEERLVKSATSVLSHSRRLTSGFAIYVDNSEYITVCDTAFERGRDVNKENMWLQRVPC